MNPELYARAKELFIDLVDNSSADRDFRLKSLKQSEPELAKEVQDLLAKHFSRTIMMPTGKISKTTVQSPTFSTLGLKKISSNLVGGALPMSVALGAALFLIGVGSYLETELIRRTQVGYDTVLNSMAEQKRTLLHQWIRGHELRMQDWGSVLPDSNCYLLDDRGAIANPGGNLLAGFEPRGSVQEWAWIKPGRTVSQPSNGSDVFGYRDYRGLEVVGAWRWIDTLMSEVDALLESIASYFPWNEDLAERWWRANEDDLIAFARTKDSSSQ